MESYPPTPITKYGINLLREGIEPNITYTSPGGEIIFYLNGGLAPWPGVTEGIALEEGIEGMHPLFNHLDNKGARQDGATWSDTVYEPAEMVMKVIASAQSAENMRRLIRKWVASWDPENPGKLTWVTPESGEWWCYPRLHRAPTDKLQRGYTRDGIQKFQWFIRNDDAFWRSHDSVSQFQFAYKMAIDEFNRDDEGSLGPNWDQTYLGPGDGVCETESAVNFLIPGRARWTPSGDEQNTVINRYLGVSETQVIEVFGGPTAIRLGFDGQLTSSISYPASAAEIKTALVSLSNITTDDVDVDGDSGGPYTVTFKGAYAKTDVPQIEASIASGGINPYVTVATTATGSPATTATNKQVISIQLGAFFMFPFPDAAYIDIWGRMSEDGQNGIRLRLGPQWIRLSAFNNGVETVLRQRILLILPIWGETWSLVCGTAGNDRQYTVMRSGFPILTYKESGTQSHVGEDYRGVGFGMECGDGFTRQLVPPAVNRWSFGDNATVTQSGHLAVTNFGDQPGFPDLVVYGPGTFFFSDGPGADPTIEFGPLADGQVALIKTHPGQRAVYDITTDQTEQDLPFFQDFLHRLISLAFNGNIPPLMQWFESIFGIEPPQGNMYALLKGRWSKPVPARGLDGTPTTHQIAVEIKDGNANSKVIAALTPMRRWPE
ncbi:minor tail protein [Mycobacterium phage Lucky2013]|nr:minor tail protein [Mycobacterium phage Lucky2013]